MRLFTLLMLLLNIGFFVWQSGLLGGSEAQPVLVRAPTQDAPRTLQLLSEMEPGDVEAAALPEDCVSVGVFASTAQSDAFMSRLLPLGVGARVRLQEVEEDPDWWVHMPPFVSRAAALRRLEELQARDIDSYLIAGGELAQGISLGLFSRRESALLVQEQLATQGYPSSILEVPRSFTEIWVDITGLSREARTQPQWRELMDRQPDLRVSEKLCETIAPSA